MREEQWLLQLSLKKGFFSRLLAWVHQKMMDMNMFNSWIFVADDLFNHLTGMNIMQFCDMQVLKFTSSPSFLNNRSEASGMAVTACAVTIKYRQLACWTRNLRKNIMFCLDSSSIKCLSSWQEIPRELIIAMAVMWAPERYWCLVLLMEKYVKRANH